MPGHLYPDYPFDTVVVALRYLGLLEAVEATFPERRLNP